MAYRKNGKVEKNDAWCRRLDASRRYRDSKANRWRENKAMLLGNQGVKGFKKSGDLVNLAWPAFQQMVGSIYAQNPRPVIREKKGALSDTAKMLTDIVVSDLEEMRSRYVTRLAIADVFWAGFGLVLEKLQSDVTSRVFRYTQAGEGESVAVPENQRYSLHRIHPESALFDSVASFPDLSDSMWLGLPFYPTKKELKESDTFYVSKEVLASARVLSAAPTLSDAQYGGARWKNGTTAASPEGSETDDEMAQVACIEVWDRVNKKKLYFIDGDDYQIGEEDWPVELRLNGELQFPASMLYFNENPDELYPIPEISMIAPQIKQYSILYRQILKDAVEKFRKFAVRVDMVPGVQNIANLLESEGNTVIPIDGRNVPGGQTMDARQVVFPIPDPQVKPDVAAAQQMVKQSVYETIGSGDLASAGFRTTRSATEAAALSDFLRSRMTTRTENMEAFFKQIITKHVLFLQDTLTERRAIETTDVNGLPIWKEYDKQTIAGTFSFSVIAGSSMPENTETSRQENIAFWQQIAPIIMQSGGNPRPFMEWISPYYKVPQHILDATFSNHKQALQQLALLFAAAHNGAKITGADMNEAIAAAVNSGLSQADLQRITQAASAPAPGQPGGMPGTNPSNQTVS